MRRTLFSPTLSPPSRRDVPLLSTTSALFLVLSLLLLSSSLPPSSSSSFLVSAAGTNTLIPNAIHTRTDISHHAGITTSIQKMFAACESNDFSKAKEMYESKYHSKYSLKELATADEFQNIGLTFAFQMYGLMNVHSSTSSNDNGNVVDMKTGENIRAKDASTGTIRNDFDSFTDAQRQYFTDYTHHNLMEPTFDFLLDDDSGDLTTKSRKCTQIATAAVWQITLLHVSYELWGAMHECTISGDPNYNNAAAGIGDLNAKVDEFIAYWVGADVADLETTGKHSLFTSTNEISKKFHKNKQIHGLAHANSLVMAGYESLSGLMTNGNDACSEDTVAETVESMWITNNQIMSYMMIPLVQHLIIAMLDNDQLLIDVYAGMIVPQLAKCRHSNYVFLRDVLLNGAYDSDDIHAIMKVLQDSYDCLSIRCEDIGMPKGYNDSLLSCNDSQYKDPELAGYVATTDVREQSKIDLDIHHMKILMSYENEHYWTMAKYIYLYGKNSKIEDSNYDDDFSNFFQISFRSLHSLARSDLRKGTLFYDETIAYTNGPYYTDYYITDVFNKDRHASEPIEVKSAIISTMLSTQVVYSYVLGEMADALKTCNNNKDGKRSWKSSKAWDEVAAYIIGSLEGADLGGASDFSDGELLWSLANKRGIEFDRLNSDGYAVVNSAILNYLLSGKGQIEHANCGYLERTTKNLAHMLLIPAIQTVVKYALSNQFLPFNSDDVDVYYGELFAKFLIPIYGKYSEDSAKMLQNNMIPNFNSLVDDGPQAVADAYLDIADDFGIQCEYIGKSFEVDACLNYKPELKVPTSNASVVSSNTWKLAGVSTLWMVLLHLVL